MGINELSVALSKESGTAGSWALANGIMKVLDVF